MTPRRPLRDPARRPERRHRRRLPRPATLVLALSGLLAGLGLAAVFAQPADELSPGAYLPGLHNGPAQQPSATPPATVPPLPTSTPEIATPTADPTDIPTAAPPPTATPVAVPVVMLPGDLQPDDWFVDEAEILDPVVEGDLLRLRARFGGGCVEHDFWLPISSLIMESEPPQARTLLSHQAYGDPCDAIVTRELAFDLRPLARTMQAGGSQHGTVLLRLPGWDGELRYDY